MAGDAGKNAERNGSLAGTLAELRLHGSLDLAEIGRLTVDAAVPHLTDAAAVHAVDRMLRGGESAPASGEITMRRLGAKGQGQRETVVSKTFPAGELIAFAADTAYARCLRERRPVIFTPNDGPPRVEQALTLTGYANCLALPMIAGGRVTGLLSFSRLPGSPAFGPADIMAATRLADAAGAGIANAVAMMRQRAIADALQDGLLAVEPDVPSAVEVAARCLPAAGQVIGGDWYDLITLPGGRIGFLIGDVMGHGPEAAAVMAHLRAVAHALAEMDLDPADLLGRMDHATAMLRRPTMATCAYAVLDPAEGSCAVAVAGHLPPVLAAPGGGTCVPHLPGGPSLGLGTASYRQSYLKIPPGTVIALYTDGLVESRVRSVDQGIRAVRDLLARPAGPLETTCDTLIGALGERSEDDVTVVLVRVP